ncbi:hypothetical protein K7G98_06010 [Saccharothrix sp. MB29]|nr:hypothetical protein [Saccharothrix sp. MB29]
MIVVFAPVKIGSLFCGPWDGDRGLVQRPAQLDQRDRQQQHKQHERAGGDQRGDLPGDTDPPGGSGKTWVGARLPRSAARVRTRSPHAVPGWDGRPDPIWRRFDRAVGGYVTGVIVVDHEALDTQHAE